MLRRHINGEGDGTSGAQLVGLLSAFDTAPDAGPDAVEAARRLMLSKFQRAYHRQKPANTGPSWELPSRRPESPF